MSRKLFSVLTGNIPKFCLILQEESIAVRCVDNTKIPSDVQLFGIGEDAAKHYVSEKFYKEFKKRKMKGCPFLLCTVKG